MATVTKWTNTGKAMTTAKLSGTGLTPGYVAWGTGATVAAETATTLSSESADESRSVAVLTQVTTTVTNDTLQIVGTITCATNDKSITNMGAFDANAVGNLFILSSFTAVPLVVGEKIEATFQLKLSM